MTTPTSHLSTFVAGDMDRLVEVDGARVHYLTAGTSSQHLLLLHGSGADSSHLSYRELLGPLSEHFTVVAPDFPGYGQSDVTARADTTEGLIHFVHSFLDTLGIEKAHVAGLSMGGGVALGLALHHPQRVDRVVLMGSHGLTRRSMAGYTALLVTRMPPSVYGWSWRYASSTLQRTRRAMRRVWGDHTHLDDELLAEVRRELGRPDAWRVIRNWARDESRLSGYRTCYLDQLRDLDTPVLLVHGAKDKLVPTRTIQKSAPRFPNATLNVIPACGHWIPREGRAELIDALSAFLLPGATAESPEQP